jgi:hypothetical protein
MPKVSNHEHLATLKAKARQIRAQITEAEAVARKAQRKRDTRLKILVGAAVLADAARHDATKSTIREIVARAITASKDRQFLAEVGWIETANHGWQPRGSEFEAERQAAPPR